MITPEQPRLAVLGRWAATLTALTALLAQVVWAATLTVSTTTDQLTDVGNEINDCSLREAIISVNSGQNRYGCAAVGTYGSNDRIVVPAGKYELTFAAAGFDDPETGNLNILAPVVIDGAGANRTVVDAKVVQGTANGGGAFDIHGEGRSIAVTLRGMTIQNGRVVGFGGAISAYNVDLTLERVVVRDSRADNGGGGLYLESGDLRIVGSTFHGNRTSNSLDGDAGGALYLDGDVEVLNSTISGNTASASGGGVHVASGILALSSVTISKNSVTAGRGGGVRNLAGEVRVANSLIAGNADTAGAPTPDCDGVFDSFGFNLVGVADGCSGFTRLSDIRGTAANPRDPLLAALAGNGGTTPTHALLLGSPAIDRGGIVQPPPELTVDQRGRSRPSDGDGDGTARYDIGAYEREGVTNADVALALVGEPDPVAAGALVTYTMTIRNHGPAIATAVTASASVTGGDVVNAGNCQMQGAQGVVCALGDVAVDAVVTRSFVVVANVNAPSVAVTAEAIGQLPDPDLANNADTETTTVRPPDVALDVAVSDERDPVVTGDAFTYTVTVKNGGPDSAVELVVTGKLTGGATLVDPGTTCTQASDTSFTCSVGRLGAGESTRRTVTVRAPGSPTTVALEASAKGAFTAAVTASQSTQVRDPAADLSVEILGVAPGAEVEETFTYQLRVQNHGPQDAENLTVRFDSGGTLELIPAGGGCTQAGPVWTCTYARLDAGAAQWIAVQASGATVNLVQPEPVTLRASVAAQSPEDPVASNDEVTREIVFVPRNADLAIAKRGPAAVQAGASFAYTLVVTNLDPQDASGPVQVRDLLPDGVAFVSATSSPDVFQCSAAGQAVTCEAGQLDGGQEAVVVLSVTAPTQAGSIANRGQVQSATLDLEASNDVSDIVVTDVTAEAPAAGADLRIVKAAPRSVGLGASLRYVLTVVNDGPDTASEVIVTDTLPAEVGFVAATAGCARSGPSVTCSVGALAAGGVATVTIDVEAPATPGDVINTANVAAATVDPDPSNDADTATTTVTDATADLVITKSAPASARVGDTFAYRLNVFNAGPDAAPGVVVSDVLPSEVRFVSAAASCAFAAGVVTCDLGTLASGASVDLTIQVLAEEAGVAVNTAGVAAGAIDPTPDDNEDDATTVLENVIAGPPLEVRQGNGSHQDRSVAPGAKNEPALHVTVENVSDEGVQLGRFELLASGTGQDALDLSVVRVLLDANGDGAPDGGNDVLASGRFDTDDGTLGLDLDPAPTIAAGSSIELLVVVDIDEDAAGRLRGPAVMLGAFGALGASVLAFRRRRRFALQAVLVIGLVVGLAAGCTQQPPVQQNDATYRLTLSQVGAVGAESGLGADARGLPIVGARLRVPR
ncbi:MAG: choice-of-anchor Q domain-containing protein [Trueperaceae bacterium]